MAPPITRSPGNDRPRERAGEQDRRVREDGGEVRKGLCVNCAYRDACLLPRSEGGVWHCEKYAEDVDDARGGANGDESDRGMT